jgi:hypothetical protein
MRVKNVLHIVATLLLFITANYFSTTAIANSDQGGMIWSGPQKCRFIPPADWHDRTLSWDGPCQEGKAHGEGVLRAYKKAEPTLIFFGDITNGELSLGVIENAEGYIAGQFSKGKVVADSDRNVLIKAFSKGSAAARAYGQRLKKAGNLESSKLYMKKAQELEQQID